MTNSEQTSIYQYST